MTAASPFTLRMAAAALALAAAPALAGPPFATDDPEPAPAGHVELYLFTEGVRTHDGEQGDLPGFEINYGLAEDWQLALAVGQAFEAPAGGSPHSRYDATEIGLKYRFVHESEDGWQPQVAFYPSVEIPDGGVDPVSFLPLWLQKSIGEWEVFGGGGPHFTSGAGHHDNWFGGIGALRHVTRRLELGGEVFRETAYSHDERGSSDFNLAALYELSDTWQLVASAGRGIDHVAQHNEFAYYLGVGLTR